jgi:hypothetical protein
MGFVGALPEKPDTGGRAARADWVQQNASLATSGQLAAQEVLAAVRPSDKLLA